MNYGELETLLKHRLEVIGDHEMRENDPDRQLELLKSVSMKIDAWRDTFASEAPFKLRHFLENYSLDKALAFVQAVLAEERGESVDKPRC